MILRSDNRTADQIRRVNIVPDFISTAEGSAVIEMGNTQCQRKHTAARFRSQRDFTTCSANSQAVVAEVTGS